VLFIPQSQNLYTYVEHNPLTNVDPTGHFCVSTDGKNSHGGTCNSTSSIYKGLDEDWVGAPIIDNGVLQSYLGTYGPFLPEKKNYWDWEKEQIQKAKETQKKIDEMYENTSDIQKPYLLQAMLSQGIYPRGSRKAWDILRADIKDMDISYWKQGSYDSTENSLLDHFIDHGHEVNATNAAQYYRKAIEFKRTLKGARMMDQLFHLGQEKRNEW
jgi:hypothetical protein